MEKKLPLEEMSISDVYVKSQYVVTYKIPVYQRNYAWEEEQVTALIKDIYDSWQKNPLAQYYIGTLVTYKRNDMEYEVIDGQQRLTTIYLIIKALGIKDIKNKLTYSARSTSTSTIMRLNENWEMRLMQVSEMDMVMQRRHWRPSSCRMSEMAFRSISCSK